LRQTTTNDPALPYAVSGWKRLKYSEISTSPASRTTHDRKRTEWQRGDLPDAASAVLANIPDVVQRLLERYEDAADRKQYETCCE
jgi:hypothetical protein